MIKKSIEILIPAYNEEKNVEGVIKKSLLWLKSQTNDYSVLVVDDGSTDRTGEILDSLEKKYRNLKVIHHEKNLGIGRAWRTLYEFSTKEIIFTCPADQQFNPADFSRALPYIDKVDIISFYRPKKKDYSPFRLILTNINRLLIRIFFNLKIRDVNWVKMYKKEVLKQLDLKLKSALIETEILAKVKKINKKIIEIKAPYHPRVYGKSKGASMKTIWLSFIELVKAYLSVRIFKY